MSDLPTGIVTFLFTDIEGSTQLSQEYPTDMSVLLARHNEILRQEIDARFNVVVEKSNLAHMERKLGNYEDALGYYRETIRAFRDMGQPGAVAHQLECFGFIAVEQDQKERALRLFAAANALRGKAGTPMRPEEKTYFDQQMQRLRIKMSSPTLEWMMTKGHAMPMDRAIELAITDS